MTIVNKVNIESIIVDLEHECQDIPSYLGLYRSNIPTAEENDIYILANEQGVIRSALELLTSITSKERDEKGFCKIELSELVKQGDFNLKYIKTSASNNDEQKVYLDDSESFRDKVWKYGCFCLVFIIAVCFIWGLISILNFIYNLF